VSQRFKDSGEACKEVHEGFNAWSSGAPSFGRQMAYAIIAANWAVHATGDHLATSILSNHWAKCSMIVTLCYLGVNLILAWFMGILYDRRVTYTETDKDRWEREFNAYQTASAESSWPYTMLIEMLGKLYRFINMFFPLLGGVLLVVSMFSDSNN
jgi:hypothetical protein